MKSEPVFSPAQRQSDLSVQQLSERLILANWNPHETRRDVGEDLFVQINDENGYSSGTCFLVQLKSTTNIEELKLKTEPCLSYEFETRHLRRWQNHTYTIVLVVWDIIKRSGNWILATDAIAALKAGWEENECATVRIPLENDMSDTALAKLRRAVANEVLPLLFDKHESLKATGTFLFPATPEGQEAAVAWKRFIDHGDAVKVDGKFIQSLTFSEWWSRAMGPEPLPTWMEFQPMGSKVSLPVRLELESDAFDSPVVFEYVELRHVKGGKETLTVSNEHQKIPFHLTIRMEKFSSESSPSDAEKKVVTWVYSFTVNANTVDVFEAREAIRALMALRELRGVRMIDLSNKNAIMDRQIRDLKIDLSMDQLRLKLNILEDLCLIQRRIGRLGRLQFNEDCLDAETLEHVKYIADLCRCGEVRDATIDAEIPCGEGRFSLEEIGEWMSMLDADPDDRQHWLLLEMGETTIELLGVSISLGMVAARAIDTRSILLQLEEAVRKGEQTIRVKSAQAIITASNWSPDGKYLLQSPSSTAAPSRG